MIDRCARCLESLEEQQISVKYLENFVSCKICEIKMSQPGSFPRSQTQHLFLELHSASRFPLRWKVCHKNEIWAARIAWLSKFHCKHAWSSKIHFYKYCHRLRLGNMLKHKTKQRWIMVTMTTQIRPRRTQNNYKALLNIITANLSFSVWRQQKSLKYNSPITDAEWE